MNAAPLTPLPLPDPRPRPSGSEITSWILAGLGLFLVLQLGLLAALVGGLAVYELVDGGRILSPAFAAGRWAEEVMAESFSPDVGITGQVVREKRTRNVRRVDLDPQGEMVAEIVAGNKRSWDKRAIPAVCFTDPEIVTAGLSPDEARAQRREIKIGIFPFSANGRAMTMLGETGFVRVVARADNHLVLGIQAVGHGVSELSTAFGLALAACDIRLESTHDRRAVVATG